MDFDSMVWRIWIPKFLRYLEDHKDLYGVITRIDIGLQITVYKSWLGRRTEDKNMLVGNIVLTSEQLSVVDPLDSGSYKQITNMILKSLNN